MTEQFKDCFSKVAAGYAAFRPSYPSEMFDWLAAHSPRRALAWDCACGSGQATLPPARHFERVESSAALGFDNVGFRLLKSEMHPASSIQSI